MGVETTLKIRNKHTKDKGIVLMSLSTTPTRELLDLCHLDSSGDDWVSLSENDLREIIEAYQSEILRNNKSSDAYSSEADRLANLMKNVKSVEIYREIEKDLQSVLGMLNYLNEENESLLARIADWKYAVEVLELQYNYNTCSNDYELVYSIG